MSQSSSPPPDEPPIPKRRPYHPLWVQDEMDELSAQLETAELIGRLSSTSTSQPSSDESKTGESRPGEPSAQDSQTLPRESGSTQKPNSSGSAP